MGYSSSGVQHGQGAAEASDANGGHGCGMRYQRGAVAGGGREAWVDGQVMRTASYEWSWLGARRVAL